MIVDRLGPEGRILRDSFSAYTSMDVGWYKRLILEILSQVYLSIGTNQGDREKNLQDCITLISQEIGEVRTKSAVYETISWGFESDDFLNQVCEIFTKLDADDCLLGIQGIEEKMGRQRSTNGYEPRVIDIDILTFGDLIVDKRGLCIPHPRIGERMFVLEPWAEIAASYTVPGAEVTVLEMKERCMDQGECRRVADV